MKAAPQDGDRVTLDFAGTIDGVPFEGGKAEGFPFVLGQGRMLPEFEEAARGLKAGETKVFPLKFPDDYQGKEVAGKTAEFTITVKEVAEGVLPELNGEFAKSSARPKATWKSSRPTSAATSNAKSRRARKAAPRPA